jgi:hypothetical protein
MDREQQTTPIVEAWLKGTSDTPYGTEMGVGRVKSRVRHTSQRGRWWPLPSFQRTPAPTPPIPVTNGHSPTATARTMPMFSATKFVVAGVIVALFGGFLLSGVVTQPSDDSLPAAASASASTQVEPTVKATGESEPAPEDTEAEKADPTVRPDVLPGTFALAGSLAEHRLVFTATLLPDGRVLVVGGGVVYDTLASAEVWEPNDR